MVGEVEGSKVGVVECVGKPHEDYSRHSYESMGFTWIIRQFVEDHIICRDVQICMFVWKSLVVAFHFQLGHNPIYPFDCSFSRRSSGVGVKRDMVCLTWGSLCSTTCL